MEFYTNSLDARHISLPSIYSDISWVHPRVGSSIEEAMVNTENRVPLL